MSKKSPEKSVPTAEEREWFASQLTHEVWKQLYGLAFQLMGNRHDAEDILGDSIQIGLSSVSKLRDREKFNSWMFKIVLRESYRRYKQDKKRQMGVINFAISYLRDYYEVSKTPDKLLISKEESERLRREIERLKSPEKEIMLLKLTTTKTLKEIAADLDLNYHTTRSKFTRTCELIKKRLEDEGGDGSYEEK